jgi:hypothetical protein
MIQISFNYNEDTKTVDNVIVRNISHKDEKHATVEVKENKLVISPKAVTLLGCIAGDRISVQYYQESKEVTFPVIGRSSVFADEDNGNKLTKSNTVSFKGFQHELLLRYGNIFTLEQFNDEVYKLVPKDNNPFDIQKVF